MADRGLKSTFFAGTKRRFRFEVRNTDANDAAFDLTAAGLVVRWAMTRFRRDDPTRPITPTDQILINKTSASATEIELNPDSLGNNFCDVILDATDTDNSFVGQRYSELEVIDGISEPVVLATVEHTILDNVENP